MGDDASPRDPAGLYRAHAERLARYVHRLTGDTAAAEDVTQEVFTRLLERPPRHTAHLKAWLFTTATNLVRDRARRRARADEVAAREGAGLLSPRAAPDPLRQAEQASVRHRLQEALAALNERERVAVLMREEGFAHREIAEALGTTTGTIGTLLARALANLAQRLPLDREDR